MVALDFLEMLKAIRMCVQKQNYHVGVFTVTAQDAEHVCSEMIDAISEDEEEKDLVAGMGNGAFRSYILFKNRSSINFVRASDSARGHKFHHVLYDRRIDHDLLATIVHPTEIRYIEQEGEAGDI